MDGMRFTASFHVPGTLAADLAIVFDAPCDCKLVELQSCTSNTSNATISMGTVADAAAYLVSHDVGDAATPNRKKLRTDFVGAQFPRITAGTHVKIAVDYDGSSGTAGANLTVMAVFLEG